jgi:hypothetical protein
MFFVGLSLTVKAKAEGLDSLYDKTFTKEPGDVTPAVLATLMEGISGYSALFSGPGKVIGKDATTEKAEKQVIKVKELEDKLKEASADVGRVKFGAAMMEYDGAVSRAVETKVEGATDSIVRAVRGSAVDAEKVKATMNRAVTEAVMEANSNHGAIARAVDKSPQFIAALEKEAQARVALLDSVQELARLRKKTNFMKGVRVVRIGFTLYIVAEFANKAYIYFWRHKDPGAFSLYKLAKVALNEGRNTDDENETTQGYLDHYDAAAREAEATRKRLDKELEH